MQNEKIHTESLNSLPKPLEKEDLIKGEPYTYILEDKSVAVIRDISHDMLLYDLLYLDGRIISGLEAQIDSFLTTYKKCIFKSYKTWNRFMVNECQEDSTILSVKIPIGESFAGKDEVALFDGEFFKIIGSCRFNIPEGKAEENPNVMFRVTKVL